MAKLHLSIDAFNHNLALLRSKTQTEIALMLKDNAYGHGLLEIAQLAALQQIKNVFVKNWNEAKQIINLFPNITILYPNFKNLPCLIPENINLVVNHVDQLDFLPKGAKIEIKVNTNTNRNGILPEELDTAFFKSIQRNLVIYGVFTHNGYSNNENVNFIRGIEMFNEIKKLSYQLCHKNNLPIPRFHSLCSSGMIRFSNNEDNLVRIGLAIYGYLDYHLLPFDLKLKPVASVWSNRISCKKLTKGTLIGYDGFTKLQHSGYVSTYDLGYGDGFPLLTNENFYLPCGLKMFPKNSMDCFSTWGKKNELCVWNDAKYVANIFKRSVYEILVHLSPFMQRILI